MRGKGRWRNGEAVAASEGAMRRSSSAGETAPRAPREGDAERKRWLGYASSSPRACPRALGRRRHNSTWRDSDASPPALMLSTMLSGCAVPSRAELICCTSAGVASSPSEPTCDCFPDVCIVVVSSLRRQVKRMHTRYTSSNTAQV